MYGVCVLGVVVVGLVCVLRSLHIQPFHRILHLSDKGGKLGEETISHHRGLAYSLYIRGHVFLTAADCS